MFKNINIKAILYKTDFIGLKPELRILNNDNYKSLPTSLISICIIIFSFTFIINSFIDYINQSPIIEYYKSIDYKTNKSFLISDSFLMFSLIGPLEKNFNIIPYYTNNSDERIFLDFEPCELGKNINIKYKNLVEFFEKNEESYINEYFCVNFNQKNISIFQNNSKFYNEENYLTIAIYGEEKNSFKIQIVTENDIIEHYNKDNPIIPHYHFENIMIAPENGFLKIDYYFQYIKYESDNGLFFKNSKNINAIGFLDIDSFEQSKNENLYSKEIMINFKMNQLNYDLYKRTYIKFNSFLANVMSVLNVIVIISKQISYFLLNKKMSKDIVRNIITINEDNENKKNKLNKVKSFKDIQRNKTISERKYISPDSEDNTNSNSILNNSKKIKSIFPSMKEFKIIQNRKKINILKKINLCDIIKSFFCCNDNKSKLINICHNIVIEDFCIDKILKRIYELEKINNIISEEEYLHLKYDEIKEFLEINEFISKINMETNNIFKNQKKNSTIK